MEAALRTSAMILVVTGLGGSLSAILRGTPAVDFIAMMFTDYGLPTILLPFVIGIIGNLITGSTTVGVITAASLVAPMLGTLGLSPEAAMLAGASGSVIIKYVNSSYFWVCTSLTKLSVADAVFSYGGRDPGRRHYLFCCRLRNVGSGIYLSLQELLCQSHLQNPRHMNRFAARPVLNLVPATCAIGNDQTIGIGFSYRWQQT